MNLYHPDAEKPIDCHPSKVAQMKRQGWSEDPKKANKPKKPDSSQINNT